MKVGRGHIQTGQKLTASAGFAATSSVDLETDERIQQTIQREFRTHTLLCIAHRLRTILGWDRILVMAQGQIQEFGAPLELFDIDGGNFRGMCERSNISRQEIEKAQAQAAVFKGQQRGSCIRTGARTLSRTILHQTPQLVS